jgi:hypothetical protein
LIPQTALSMKVKFSAKLATAGSSDLRGMVSAVELVVCPWTLGSIFNKASELMHKLAPCYHYICLILLPIVNYVSRTLLSAATATISTTA